MLCQSCGLVQLTHNLPSSAHFHDDYTYLSGASSTWVAHCRDYADAVIARFGLLENDFVVEVGSNDGTLLQALRARGIRVLGIEPSGNVAEIARLAGVPTETMFFGPDVVEDIRQRHGSPKLLIGNNVLAHVPDPNAFLAAASSLVAPDGALCFEFPHCVKILEDRYFDTIYHEHYTYLAVGPLLRWAERNAMEIGDAILQPTHGGSVRLMIGRAGARWHSEAGRTRAEAVLATEADIVEASRWHELGDELAEWRRDFLQELRNYREQGLKVMGYAAASKATVLANYVGLDETMVAMCGDASTLKQGRIIPGTGIPIVSPAQLAAAKPDVVVVFAWNIFPEVVAQLSATLDPGVILLRPLPQIAARVLTGKAI